MAYFTTSADEGFEEREETVKAQQARLQINRALDEIHKIISAAGVSTVIGYAPPPITGGLAGNIDVLLNVFNIQRYGISPNTILDQIDRAIGIYENNKRAATLRWSERH